MADSKETWLICGLGNPGPRYEKTPHNLGFLAVDRLAERHQIRISRPEANSLVGLGEICGISVVLQKPQTFMNVSGPALKSLLQKYGISKDRLVLVYDDLDLPWTGVRIRPSGSSGGHNGVKSVIESLGGEQNFPRVRLGIDPGHPLTNGAEFVLAPFKKKELEDLEEWLDFSSQAIESILADGVEKAMTRFNRRAKG
jgi:peptidyl-tRNA hydrolase, PTH1 family